MRASGRQRSAHGAATHLQLQQTAAPPRFSTPALPRAAPAPQAFSRADDWPYLRFTNMLIADATYLLDESLKYIKVGRQGGLA